MRFCEICIYDWCRKSYLGPLKQTIAKGLHFYFQIKIPNNIQKKKKKNNNIFLTFFSPFLLFSLQMNNPISIKWADGEAERLGVTSGTVPKLFVGSLPKECTEVILLNY